MVTTPALAVVIGCAFVIILFIIGSFRYAEEYRHKHRTAIKHDLIKTYFFMRHDTYTGVPYYKTQEYSVSASEFYNPTKESDEGWHVIGKRVMAVTYYSDSNKVEEIILKRGKQLDEIT